MTEILERDTGLETGEMDPRVGPHLRTPPPVVTRKVRVPRHPEPPRESIVCSYRTERDTGLEPVTPSLGSRQREPIGQDSSGLERDSAGGTDQITRDPAEPCTVPVLSATGLGMAPNVAEAELSACLRVLADAAAAPFLSTGGNPIAEKVWQGGGTGSRFSIRAEVMRWRQSAIRRARILPPAVSLKPSPDAKVSFFQTIIGPLALCGTSMRDAYWSAWLMATNDR